MPELRDPDPLSSVSEKSGLPTISPDVVEQEEGDQFDNIIPTKTYATLPVVGLGGSAGSIVALQRFFATVPVESGLAFVVVLHLAPENASIMDEIIGRATRMPVVQASDGEKVEANHVYVIPPGKFISMADGHLRLTPIEAERGKRIAVDLFFRTLADSHGPNASAIILSGALGIKRIKERGGLTVAQDPDEAEHPSMPRTAIDTGMVDWVLPVAQMPERLVEYRANGKRLTVPSEEGPQPAKAAPNPPDADEAALREVLAFLRSRTGRDFSPYKRATVVRRVARRMQVNGVATMPEYLLFIRTHPGEAGALQDDLLISVTNFFRDRECFEALEAEIPKLFAGKGAADVVRVWTAGCATGEEAYSIAMLLLEHAGKLDAPPSIQVFATDLAEDVITVARDGLYPFASAADVSEERLRRFFVKEHRGYRARRELREAVLFAVHDLLRDAPFSRLDMFTCRNLLIYLTAEAQKRVFDTAHFALKPEGFLFIGTSEAVDDEGKMWTCVDKKHRIFRQRPVARVGALPLIGPGTLGRAAAAQERAKGGPYLHGPAFSQTSTVALRQDAERAEVRQVSWEELHFKLIERFAPPSLIVTRDYDIAHMSETAGQFLHFGGGEPSVNLLKVVHPTLRIELRAALFRAAQTSAPVEVFRVPVDLEGRTVTVDIRVSPAQEIAPDYLLVVFAVREEVDSALVQARQEAEPAVRHLEREIEQMKTRLRDTVEQYEASSEELKASNEELQAMNEELRSSAEELETSREELQSVNEELTTVNGELKSKVDDLGHSNADLANLMAATGVATIFLDRTLAITHYTPSAVALFRPIPTDLGRPLTDLAHRLNYPELQADVEQVLETLIPTRREVSDGEHWFLAQLLPYRAAEDRIAGVVLSFVDITETRQAERAKIELAGKLERQTRIFDTALSSIADFVYTFDRAGRFTFSNQPLCRLLGRSMEEVVGCTFHDLEYPPELATRLQAEVEHVFTTRETVVGETPFTSPSGESGYYEYIFQPVLGVDGAVETVAGSTRVITDRKRAEAALRVSEERMRTLADAVPQIIWANNAEGVANYFNQRWGEFTGLSFEESAVAGWQAIVHPDDAPASKERWLRAQATGEVFDTEYRLRRADGEYCWFIGRNVPVRDEEGHVTGWFGTATDIHELKKAERALGESSERLRLIVESAEEHAIITKDLERRITSWNPGAERTVGYTAEEIIGQSCDVIFTQEDCAIGQPELEVTTALADGRASDERWHVRKDGSRFWGSGVMLPMRDRPGGAVIGFLKIFRDETERLRARDALEGSRAELWAALQETERARAEAESASVAKDHFLAVLSHELRTPLTPVIMALRILARDRSLSPASAEALAMIQRNVQIEAHFIDDMLDVTRIARGKMEIVREPTSLHEAITQAVEIAAPDMQGKAQTLTVSLHAGEHTLQGDSRRLQQVFWNLLKNASKFTPARGAISISSRNEAGRIVVEVRDSGIGFEPDAAERIFIAFEQADKAVTREFGGLGLGLAISKATVDAHGGALRAESAGPGKGASFIVELPLTTEK